ncbi:MAG: hypothetical protein AAF918_19345 [Pseudomonadota bacterium]
MTLSIATTFLAIAWGVSVALTWWYFVVPGLALYDLESCDLFSSSLIVAPLIDAVRLGTKTWEDTRSFPMPLVLHSANVLGCCIFVALLSLDTSLSQANQA